MLLAKYILVFLSVLRLRAYCAPVKNKNLDFALNYLSTYGYMKPSNVRVMNKGGRLPKRDLKKSLLYFQNFFGLRKTGVFDAATLEIMKKPRCGNADILRNPHKRKIKLWNGRRFNLNDRVWPTRHLTYNVIEHPINISYRNTARVIDDAFARWASVTPLTFRRVETQNANMKIEFVNAIHNCEQSFELTLDQNKQVLAHSAPYPHGFTHFFKALKWTVGRYEDTLDLTQTATHEIGHVLGLHHSQVKDSIMYPVYNNDMPRVTLKRDDIEGIQAMYGAREDDDRKPWILK